MANLDQHKKDCSKWLGSDFEEVHLWMDEFFTRYGSEHRRMRHHREGIEQARGKFGERGAEAATIHILRDCRNIPSEQDYSSGIVDILGLRREWPVAAYIKYTEEAFAKLVQYKLHGPTGLILWAFSGDTPAPLLNTLTKLTPEEIEQSMPKWEAARKHWSSLPPISDEPSEVQVPGRDANAFLDRMKQVTGFSEFLGRLPGAIFGYVPVAKLICPLVMVDYEYLEELRAELQGDDEEATARFSLPLTMTTPLRAASDPAGKSVTIVSSSKTLTVADMQMQHSAAGHLQVVFTVANTPNLILVSKVGNRFYLKNGIHRAFLLAGMGLKDLLCLVTNEEQVPNVIGAYPSFTPEVLSHSRPPLLIDFLDDSLALTAPLRRVNKIVRISVQDFLVPVE